MVGRKVSRKIGTKFPGSKKIVNRRVDCVQPTLMRNPRMYVHTCFIGKSFNRLGMSDFTLHYDVSTQ